MSVDTSACNFSHNFELKLMIYTCTCNGYTCKSKKHNHHINAHHPLMTHVKFNGF